MKNYDQLKNFIDYTDRGAWKKYFQDLVGLWQDAFTLREFHEGLKQEFHKLPLTSIGEKEKPLLLGGVEPDREEIYTRNSLAKFYNKFFGLKIGDIQSWVISKREEAPTEVEVEVTETEFIKFAREIFNTLDTTLQYQSLLTSIEEPSLDYEELKNNPQKVKEVVERFYQLVIDLSVNHNYRTFFLWSLNQVPEKFLKSAYPMFDEILDFLTAEMGLAELTWNNPIKPESDAFEDYKIYCFPEFNPNEKGKSAGGSICKMNKKTWNALHNFNITSNDPLSFLFAQVPDLKKEFKERVEARIPENYHRNIYYKGVTASPNSTSKIENSGKSLMELLDDNSPRLFLGLIEINYVSDNSISFKAV